MMDPRERVLAASPYGDRVAKSEPVTEDDVRRALDDIQRRGIQDDGDGRVIAYAHYAGVDDARIRNLVTIEAAARMLRQELASQRKVEYRDPSRFVEWVARGTTIMQVVSVLKDDAIGWAFSMIDLIADLHPTLLSDEIANESDHSHLVPIYLLVTFVHPSERPRVLRRLMASDGEFTAAIAGELLLDWIRMDVLGPSATPHNILQIVTTSERSRAIVVFGGLLDDLLRWFQYAQLNEDAATRAKQWLSALDTSGRSLVVMPADVDTLIKAAGDRDIQVLAAIIHWAVDPTFTNKATERLHRHAKRLFHREFESSMRSSSDDRLRDVTYPEWIVDALIHILRHVGLDVIEFTSAYNGLASDAFSKMTRHSVWLRDRARAICLIVIGAHVANLRNDERLLSVARELAADVNSQPPHQAVFSEQSQQEMQSKFGFLIPVA